MIYRLASFLLTSFLTAESCTNIIVTPGASEDSSSIISYNADSGSLFGSLYHYPAATYESGTMRDIYDWDSGVYLGEIPEVTKTYNVAGNVNEYGLMIGETTFGGISSLSTQTGAIMDYGSLIWVTLQRATNARSAILTIADLMEKYGYASSGESFSIADQKEAWVMEIIGKGDYEKGAVWVARRVPDGYVCSHANQARITTFPQDGSSDTLYASDVISFARDIGLYTGSDADFSFSDVYDPVDFGGARYCEARVWSFFGSIMGETWADQYLDYAQGYNLTNRMPLWVKPTDKISVQDTMAHMRNHYEDTPLSMSGESFSDVGAESGYSPNRFHPLTWSSGGKSYFNERPISTQQTGWNFVAQSRAWMPAPLAAIMWFGVDDSATTVRFPVYGSATSVSSAFAGAGAQDGVTTPILKFNLESAFTVFNLMAHFAYSRWNVAYPEILEKILELQDQYTSEIVEVDEKALSYYDAKDPSDAIEYVTEYSSKVGDSLLTTWLNFYGELFMKYRDGYLIQYSDTSGNPGCMCSVASEPYTTEWYERIVTDTGDHYEVPPTDTVKAMKHPRLQPISKAELLKKK